jgi:hypothetical protein
LKVPEIKATGKMGSDSICLEDAPTGLDLIGEGKSSLTHFPITANG